jgi:hypothetical protein
MELAQDCVQWWSSVLAMLKALFVTRGLVSSCSCHSYLKCCFHQQDELGEEVGTAPYMAPEIILRNTKKGLQLRKYLIP